nr:MAG TPA: hypothetical protein [Bacteriophage sp.]
MEHIALVFLEKVVELIYIDRNRSFFRDFYLSENSRKIFLHI